MKIKEKIRQKVSQDLDVLIPENQWEKYFELLDRNNTFTRKTIMILFLHMCQSMEVLEHHVEDLYLQIDLLEGKKQEVAEEGFKLRKSYDIYLDLDACLLPSTKSFHITAHDFKILEKAMTTEISNNDSTKGYHKEINPKTGKEEVCLLYKELPIFKKK